MLESLRYLVANLSFASVSAIGTLVVYDGHWFYCSVAGEAACGEVVENRALHCLEFSYVGI